MMVTTCERWPGEKLAVPKSSSEPSRFVTPVGEVCSSPKARKLLGLLVLDMIRGVYEKGAVRIREAELVVRYRALLKEVVPSAKTFFSVNCIDQNHAYLPTSDMLRDGGYEVTGFQPAFDFRAKFKPELEQQVVEAFAKLLSSQC